MLFRAFLYSILLLLSLAGCSVGPAYHAPAIELPETQKNSSDPVSMPDAELVYLDYWWEVFDDIQWK